MKIVMVGPVYPFKGGISHYTGLMYRALSKKHDVTMISYKMQYPKILFKKEQRDYSNDMFKIDDTDFLINTANPFNWIKTVRKINKINPDLVIFQWWHPYFSPCYWSICKGIKRHTKIMFLCHNVFPHEHFPMDRLLSKMVLNNGDFFIVQSSMDRDDLLSVKPDAEVKLTVHPTYNAFKITGMTKDEARRILNISHSDRILLFFGFVREYKGLKHLINAMPRIVADVDNVRLFVVGDFAGDKDAYLSLIEEKDVGDRISIYDGYIPDKEVEKFFAACDLVVLPYESATQSGIVQIAYGFEKPVIATRVGGLPEVVIDEKTGYIVEPFNSGELAEKIGIYFAENKYQDFHAGIVSEAEKYSWDRMEEIVTSFWAGETSNGK